MASENSAWQEPTSVAELRLPPTFVAEHCIRTLFYQGAMSPLDMARHWHVHPDVAAEIVYSLKAAGAVELDSGQATFERHGRVRLTSTGQAQVSGARSRTWYAGPLPVPVEELGRRLDGSPAALATAGSMRAAFNALDLDPARADEIGQAVAGGATLALRGVAYDEQRTMAEALGAALSGDVLLPYAVFAHGAVIRVFDRQVHRRLTAEENDDGDANVLRSHDRDSQWTRVARPVVVLSGGVVPSDVVPAYDADAKFYVAPAPLAATGGLLAVCDCESNGEALADLARLWLVPARHGAGILRLRSGERVEVPWRTATVLFGDAPAGLPAPLREALTYVVDVSPLSGDGLRRFLARRLEAVSAPAETIEAAAELLERADLASRGAAAQVARYMRDHAIYEGCPPDLADLERIRDAVDEVDAALKRRQARRAA